MNPDLVSLLISGLAVWRLTHLLSAEDGPFEMIYKFRAVLGTSQLGSLLDCFYCLSIWIALPFSVWLGEGFSDVFLYWMALSGLACLLEQGTTRSEVQE